LGLFCWWDGDEEAEPASQRVPTSCSFSSPFLKIERMSSSSFPLTRGTFTLAVRVTVSMVFVPFSASRAVPASEPGLPGRVSLRSPEVKSADQISSWCTSMVSPTNFFANPGTPLTAWA